MVMTYDMTATTQQWTEYRKSLWWKQC